MRVGLRHSCLMCTSHGLVSSVTFWRVTASRVCPVSSSYTLVVSPPILCCLLLSLDPQLCLCRGPGSSHPAAGSAALCILASPNFAPHLQSVVSLIAGTVFSLPSLPAEYCVVCFIPWEDPEEGWSQHRILLICSFSPPVEDANHCSLYIC